MIKYSIDFKQKCLKAFLGEPEVTELLDAMDKGNNNRVRVLFDELTDLNRFKLDDSIYTDREVRSHNETIQRLRLAKTLHCQFMDVFINTLEKKEEAIWTLA